MERRINRRGYEEHFCRGQHLKLPELKEKAKDLKPEKKKYLFKENIPVYPRPEFHVTHLNHDTDGAGLRGIRDSNGFCAPYPEGPLRLLWWSLLVRPEDIESAERRLLDQIYPDRTEEQAQQQQSFLGKFASSPVFLDSSRLGSYRFTFPLEELLTAYSQQLCSGAQPVMRVFETVLFRQQVMYAVLVHSPANQERFSECPLLTDDPNAVCAYRDGRFIWRPEAMCKTHRFELFCRDDDKQLDVIELSENDKEFYVWDHFAIALHVEEGQVLKFGAERLRENLTYCEKGEPALTDSFEDMEQATALVKKLWPNCKSPLKPALKIEAS